MTFSSHLDSLKQSFSYRNVTSLVIPVTSPDLGSQKAELQLRWGQEEQNKDENRTASTIRTQKGDGGTGRAAARSGICPYAPAPTAL